MGVVSTALNFFLLLFYSQVVGLAPSLAGLALALALIVDAVSDPVVGWLSDRTRSRMGRRHPFLLASMLPIAFGYCLLWFPPFDASNPYGLFAYLLGSSVLLRLGLTLFDVPANALIAELTADYEMRTRISSFKVSSTWMASNVTGILMFAIWLKDDGGLAGSGLLDSSGYQEAGLVFAALLLTLIAAMLVLLRPEVPYLAEVSRKIERQPTGIAQFYRQLAQTYQNRSIIAVLGSAVFLASAMGLTSALWVYFMSFYFGMSSTQLSLIQIVYLLAAIATLAALPRLSGNRDKKSVALTIAVMFWLVDVAPYVLRTIGLFPDNESAVLLPMLLVYAFFDGVLINMLMALVLSMLTDVVEDNLLKTGRREEGVVLAGQTLVNKCSTALGTLLGGALLTMVQFPKSAGVSEVPQNTLWQMGCWYAVAMWVLGLLSLMFLRAYLIDRSDHSRAVAILVRNGKLQASE